MELVKEPTTLRKIVDTRVNLSINVDIARNMGILKGIIDLRWSKLINNLGNK